MPDFRPEDDAFSDEDFSAAHAGEDEPIIARQDELTPARWFCAACGQPNETLIDLSAGFEQEYVEDCAVCCRPNLITLLIDEETFIVSLRNELEYE
ncbi:MAG: CPXCG motif-containing cysteine-rich protein [candidate division KSB1 bacterium]